MNFLNCNNISNLASKPIGRGNFLEDTVSGNLLTATISN